MRIDWPPWTLVEFRHDSMFYFRQNGRYAVWQSIKKVMNIKRELILSHFCLQSADFSTRVEAARAAGCSGIGLWIKEYQKLRENGLSDKDMASILADNEMGLPEIEVLTGWAGDEAERAEAGTQLDIVCHMADEFGSTYLQVIGPYKGEIKLAAERLNVICEKVKAHGLEVSLEFLPFTNITNLRDAEEIIALTDSQNLGICLDSWHFFRGENDITELQRLKPDDINLLQMNDGTLVAEDDNYYRDCLTNRRLFDQGEFPLGLFMEQVNKVGYVGPVSIEIMSTELESQSANQAARAMTNSFLPYNKS